MPLKVGDKAVDFKLKGVDGKYYSLEDFKDKKVIAIAFTCNHCPYVKAYEDRMIAIQRDYGEKGFQLIAINPNDDKKYPEDSFENMIIRAREKGYNFPYLRDEDQRIVSIYGAQVTPEIFLIDKDRIIRYHGAIDDNYSDAKKVKRHYLREAIEALLEGREVEIKETRAIGCSIKWLG
ncbi:Thiol-disulfide oxidoreductase ResA [archaeon HR06]|nr:Thiol-disulfide oxidoreductase ResA [archaeon HR06]